MFNNLNDLLNGIDELSVSGNSILRISIDGDRIFKIIALTSINDENKQVDKIKKIIRRSGVEYVHEKEQGDTVEKVIEKAGDDKIIVMRSSDMSPLKRYFKGSIPLSIMNRCNVPILIVK